MLIEFTPQYSCFDDDDVKEQLSVNYWLQKNLEEGGIEERLEKVLNLVGLLTSYRLTEHPEEVDEVAYIIGCQGRDHRIC